MRVDWKPRVEMGGRGLVTPSYPIIIYHSRNVSLCDLSGRSLSDHGGCDLLYLGHLGSCVYVDWLYIRRIC